MNVYSHSDFEELLKDEENQKCFDCDKKPAQWASVNNAIYLCLNCAGVHRGFGVNISYMRSITMDSWSENQMNLMRFGGNRRLKDLLDVFGYQTVNNNENLYGTVLLDFYRKLLKSEISQGKKPDMPEPKEAFNPYVDQSNNSNNSDPNKRFQAVGSNNDNSSSNSSGEQGNNVMGSFNAWMGTAYNKTKQIAFNVKDKVSEMDLGTKIKSAGLKTYEVVKDTGTKVVNKGTEAAKSSTVQNFAKKANDGVNYLFGKLFGNGKKSEDNTKHENEPSGELDLKRDFI